MATHVFRESEVQAAAERLHAWNPSLFDAERNQMCWGVPAGAVPADPYEVVQRVIRFLNEATTGNG